MQADLPEAAATSPASILASNSPAQSSRKRKAGSSTGTGSRGVASLTPEQLAKKRANDRDAQRAIRERTKQTIEGLERRIRELESQQPYQELQVVLRQKEAIQAENDEIRRRLTNVLAIIQPVVGAQRLTDLASAAHHNVQAGLAEPANAFQQGPFLSDPPRPYSDAAGFAQGQTSSYIYGPQEASSGPDSRGWQASSRGDGVLDQPERDNAVDHRGMSELSDTGDRNTFNFLLGSLGHRDNNTNSNSNSNNQVVQQPPVTRPSYPAIVGNQPYVSSEPMWKHLPQHVETTCTLDLLLTGFYESQRAAQSSAAAAAASSFSPPQITIPPYPSVSSLLDPSFSPRSPQIQPRIDPISEFIIKVIAKMPNISTLPERAALTLLSFNLIRWQLDPKEENYERLPDWMKPTEAQLETPHPAWIDFIIWPRLRDRLLSEYQVFDLDDWLVIYTAALSVNWPHEADDCLLKVRTTGAPAQQDRQSRPQNHNTRSNGAGAGAGAGDSHIEGDVIFNPIFERHVRNLDNWSLNPSILDSFPSIEGTCNVRAASHTAGAGAGAAATAIEQDTTGTATASTVSASASTASAHAAAAAAAAAAASRASTRAGNSELLVRR